MSDFTMIRVDGHKIAVHRIEQHLEGPEFVSWKHGHIFEPRFLNVTCYFAVGRNAYTFERGQRVQIQADVQPFNLPEYPQWEIVRWGPGVLEIYAPIPNKP